MAGNIARNLKLKVYIKDRVDQIDVKSESYNEQWDLINSIF